MGELNQAALSVLNRTLALATLDTEGRFSLVSGQFCELFHRPAHELIGQRWEVVCNEEDIGRVSESGRLAYRDGSTIRIEFRTKPLEPEGEVHWIGVSITALEPGGTTTGWFVSAADITDRLRDIQARKEALEALQRSNRRLASLIENLQVGVLLVGPDRRVLTSNRTFCTLLELPESPEELVGVLEDRLASRLRPLAKEPEEALEAMARLRSERAEVSTADVALLDGRILERTFVPIDPVDDAADQGHLWLIRDRTDERRMAARQAQLLAQEQLQNERLRELDEVRRDFASLVAHEFRTPLTSIIGYSEMMELDDVNDDIRSYVDVVQRNGERLLRLVSDLLSLERLESRVIPAEPDEVDVAQVVSMAVAGIQPLAADRRIEVRADVRQGPVLSGDAERLGQMIDNLLANALKFSDAGASVTVTARPAEEGWRITVSDTGIGIPEAELPDLFERFFRASNAKRLAISGSGLGLAIVRAVVDLHHGSIAVESEEGEGTSFKLVLRGLLPTGDPAADRPISA